MSRIKLYIDIDGVLFGRYGTPEKFQLRPGVGSFLTFCIQNFDCYWLTHWAQCDVERLMELLYLPMVRHGITYVNWQADHDSKLPAIDKTADWLWIDDSPVNKDIDALWQIGKLPKLILAIQDGANELEDLKNTLQLELDARAIDRKTKLR